MKKEIIISDDVKYIGVNDHEVDLFEGWYRVPNGMAYNSYVILDEKVVVMDTVDERFGKQWLDNLQVALAGRTPRYLVVQHVEPDHSGSVAAFLQAYPDTTIVATKHAFIMLKNYFGNDVRKNLMVVTDGHTLSLGKHTLHFATAPLVHWPEVMVTYDECDKILFSADAFGKFGALDVEEEWACEARRYYFGIVGKYGVQAQNLLKKAATLDIATICPLHGPILKENLSYYLNLYNIWSSYGVESEGVLVAYTSVYGHTKKAVELLVEELNKCGCPKVVVTDLARCDMSEAVEDAFRYGKVVLATTTYNLGVFPPMREFVSELAERNYQNRTIGIIENGTWAPSAARVMTEMLAQCKNLNMLTTITIHSAMTEHNQQQIANLAQTLCE